MRASGSPSRLKGRLMNAATSRCSGEPAGVGAARHDSVQHRVEQMPALARCYIPNKDDRKRTNNISSQAKPRSTANLAHTPGSMWPVPCEMLTYAAASTLSCLMLSSASGLLSGSVRCTGLPAASLLKCVRSTCSNSRTPSLSEHDVANIW